ncbi:hypothetical protein [uncultured Parabacteroides sp.]|uniref:hypothetical protein n=1 Tax=uncultured Parabacteroides sp. TaxID=512312 RepID=UPI0025EF1DED|nr:hypothetical protein [uncultured Parabacteroides sp.]
MNWDIIPAHGASRLSRWNVLSSTWENPEKDEYDSSNQFLWLRQPFLMSAAAGLYDCGSQLAWMRQPTCIHNIRGADGGDKKAFPETL